MSTQNSPSFTSNTKTFLSAQSFFITGSTGLLGKVLLLKLLLTSPTSKIYLLIRDKKGQSGKQRFQKMLRDTFIFEKYLDIDGFFDNIVIVNGDIGSERLGMSDEDYSVVCGECTCIIHMAATVNFDEPLKVAVQLNVLGTMEVLKMARDCPRLVSVVHTSTAYVNSQRFDLEVIKEKIYPLDFDPYEMVDYILEEDEAVLEERVMEIIGDYPNTYTFSKSIAEAMIKDTAQDLPLCIVRPSMITASEEFPVRGWIDSVIGPTGLLLVIIVGALHVAQASPDMIPDFVPVDHVCNGMLVAAFKTSQANEEEIPIYHLCSGPYGGIRWKDIYSYGKIYYRNDTTKLPKDKRITMPFLRFIDNPTLYKASFEIVQKYPAFLADRVRWVLGKKPKFYKLMKKLEEWMDKLAYFATHKWNYGLKNTIKLSEGLSMEDKEIFNFDIRNVVWESYLMDWLIGIQMFIINVPYNNPPKL